MVKISANSLTMLVLSVSLVMGVILGGSCAGQDIEAPVQEAPTQLIEDITPREAFTLIQENQNNPDFVILDVRTPPEFAEGHIENAVDIDFRSETFQDELNKLDKDRTYLVYCRSGARSRGAVDAMAQLDFREAYNMLGGILAWKTDGLPTVK